MCVCVSCFVPVGVVNVCLSSNHLFASLPSLSLSSLRSLSLPRLHWFGWCLSTTLLLLSVFTTCLPFSSFLLTLPLPPQFGLLGMRSTSHGLYTDLYIPFRDG